MNKKNKKGFGLLEVLVSSSIIILVLGSVVFIGRQALANSTYSQQRAEAIFLAQEGLESVRQIRDTNWIDGKDKTEWDDWATDGTHPISMIDDSIESDYFLKYYNNALFNRYMLESGEGEEITVDKQIFVRYIKIEKIPANNASTFLPGAGSTTNDVHKEINALKVTVQVKWTFGGVDKTTNVSEVLTNWRPNF